MANRLSRIVTRTGDDGTTSLGDGRRVPKESVRIEALGDVDELNSLIGLLISQLHGAAADSAASPQVWLLDVQHDLFDLGAELSVPGLVRLDEARIGALEGRIEALNAALPPLKEFLLPGGSTVACVCHLARTVCRRAERRGWAVAHAEATAPAPLNRVSLRYLNRLSDLLFVLARTIARSGGDREVLWRNRADRTQVPPD